MIRVAGFWVCLTILGGAPSALRAHAPDTRHYAQDAGTLSVQLAEVARRHGRNVLWTVPQPIDPVVPGLVGEFTLAEALARLLHPLALRWWEADGAIRIAPAAPEGAERLRLQVGTVEVEASALAADLSIAQDRTQAEPEALLAQHTAAGWSFAAPALRTLPATDLARWLARSPNAYGRGSRLSLRGIERDSFAAQTSNVRLNGLPLSSAALDAGVALPLELAGIDFALGPQPAQIGLPGFAGELRLDTAAARPLSHGLLGWSMGGQSEQRVDFQQGLDLRAAGSLKLAGVTRERAGSVVHADGRPRASERVTSVRWLLEPDTWPRLAIAADLLWLAARPADERISVPLLEDPAFVPAARRDLESGRRLSLDEYGLRVAAGWSGTYWRWYSSHLLGDGEQRQRGMTVLGREELRDADERSRVHQLVAIRAAPDTPWRLRLALDLAQRNALFSTSDALPLSALFPPAGPFVSSPGSTRLLRTAVEQRIHSRGGQLWWRYELPRWTWEFGSAWSGERRRERQSVLRSVSPRCTLTTRDGLIRDCRVELPEFRRASDAHLSDHFLTPAATLLWRPPGRGEVAVQWRRGARSGGARPFGEQVLPFQAEHSDTYELSWRTPEWRGARARLALFHNFWRDRQVQLLDPAQAGFAIVNAGRARARGGELTVTAQWSPAWSAALGIGWLHSRFENFQLAGAAAPVELAGNRFAGAPERTAVLALNRAPERGFEFGLLLSAASGAEGDAYNRDAARLPGRAEVDLRMGWRGARYSVALECVNATDRQLPEQIQLSVVSDQPRSYLYNAPRQWRAALEWRW